MRIVEELPDSVVTLLDGTDLEGRIGQVVLLIVADEGVPRIASLSVGEVLAIDSRTLAATLYESSRTSTALAAGGVGLLAIVDDGGLVKITVGAQVLGIDGGRRTFRLGVRSVEVDSVPYARLVHGMEFELIDHEQQVLERWRSQLAGLKEVMS
jgi:hypothetical protein